MFCKFIFITAHLKLCSAWRLWRWYPWFAGIAALLMQQFEQDPSYSFGMTIHQIEALNFKPS